jgi:hypothetical protein
MAAYFTAEYRYLWMLALALALFLPVRNLIFVLTVRRAQKKAEVDEAEIQRLRRRAGATSTLLCLIFAFLFTGQLFET